MFSKQEGGQGRARKEGDSGRRRGRQGGWTGIRQGLRDSERSTREPSEVSRQKWWELIYVLEEALLLIV